MEMAASVSAVDWSQIAAMVGNHFRYENSHWESINWSSMAQARPYPRVRKQKKNLPLALGAREKI